MAAVRAGRTTRWQVRLAVLAVIWGFSFVLIKVADHRLGPLWVSFSRVAFGAAALLAVLLIRRTRLPGGAAVWGHLAVTAMLNNAIPFTLFAYGETRVSSVLAGIWNATTPLFAFPVALLLLRGERISAWRTTGLLVGFGGVVLVLAPWNGIGGGSLAGDSMCLAASLSYGLGFPYTRKYLSNLGISPLRLAAGQLACATGQLGLVAALTGTAPRGASAAAIAAVAALGVFGSGLAYVLNFSIVRDAGPAVASTVTYLIPLVSSLAGVTLLGEPVGWHQPAGAAVILTGAAMVQERMRPSRGLTRRQPADRAAAPAREPRPAARARCARPGRRGSRPPPR